MATIKEQVEHIEENLDTRGEWSLDDYRDFYERDVVETLLPIARDWLASDPDAYDCRGGAIQASFLLLLLAGGVGLYFFFLS